MLTKAERTKQFILETAAPIFNQKGISGVKAVYLQLLLSTPFCR